MNKLITIVCMTIIGYAGLFAQSLTTVLLPQCIEGVSGTNANRIPFAYRAKLTGLTAGAVYRYYNQVVTSTDSDSTDGAGNCIFVSMSVNFTRTSSPGLKTAGTYGVFTADAAGTYEGWFITEPTGNTRFVPGRYVFMRVMLRDSSSTSNPTLRRTTADSVRVVKLAAAAGDTAGTGLRCTSVGRAKDLVFAYDNTAGTGRPVSGTFIEGDGTANTASNSYASFYATKVNDVSGAFGMVLPNTLPNGIRRIEERSLATGAVVVSATDADGIWPSGISTVNPIGGTAELVLTASDVDLTTGVEHTGDAPRTFTLGQNYPNPFNPTTTISFTLPGESTVTLDVLNILGERVSMLVHERMGAGTHVVRFDASHLASGIYFCRIRAGAFAGVRKMILAK